MPVVTTMSVVIPENRLSLNNIHQTVLEPMRLSWILWNLPDFNLYQRAVRFDHTSVYDQVALRHRGYLILDIKRNKAKYSLGI
jgi:hypothetical protein